MQFGHPPLAHRVEAGEGLLRLAHLVVVDPADEIFGGSPGFFGALAHDDMEPDAVAQGPAALGRNGPHLCDLLPDLIRRLAPAEIMLDMIGRDDLPGSGGTAEIERRMRLLHRRKDQAAAGRHLPVAGSRLRFPPVQQPHPPLYFGGSSGAGQIIAADHVEHYLSWGEPPDQVGQKIAEMRAVAAERGRTLRYGIRLHIIVRESAEEAWRAAEDLIRWVDDDKVREAQKTFARFDSVGQRRMAELHRGSRTELEISPNLWAGVGLVRG